MATSDAISIRTSEGGDNDSTNSNLSYPHIWMLQTYPNHEGNEGNEGGEGEGNVKTFSRVGLDMCEDLLALKQAWAQGKDTLGMAKRREDSPSQVVHYLASGA